MGNHIKDKEQSYEEAADIDEKKSACQSQPLQNGRKGGIQIEEGTDKAQGCDEITRKGTVEEKIAHPVPEKDEGGKTEDAQDTAVA